MQDSVEFSIKQYICQEIMDPDEIQSITAEQDLIGDGVIDSLGIFLLVEFIENEFGISVDAEEVVLENFSNVRSLANFVAGKRDASTMVLP
jgi:acyl carrier protein